jgi:hypothetical protein
LFDRIGADDAIFSISNAHDDQFRGSWNSPPTWRRLFSSNTPAVVDARSPDGGIRTRGR